MGDQEPKLDTEALENIGDFEFMDFEAEEETGRSEEEKQGSGHLSLGLTEDDCIDSENTESLQAMSYDGTFVVSGPVVKVYRQADADDPENDKLSLIKNFPLLRDEGNEVIKPCNLMLHNGEGSLVFCNERDKSQMFNFDLEAGKIVEQFSAEKQTSLAEMKQLTSRVKNGQVNADGTFVGISERGIYTLDPRINKKQKAAASKVYKTNPLFSSGGTTLAGGLAIGSLNGEIRLFKEVG